MSITGCACLQARSKPAHDSKQVFPTIRPNIDLTKVQATAATAQAQQCNIFWGHAGLWKQARAMRICLLNMMQFGTEATASILRSPCESWRFLS